MQPTVGIDFLAKNAFHKGKGYRLQLWDTAGQERFRSLIPSYLKDAMSAIIVFDVTNKASLQNASGWLQMFNDHKVNSGYSVLVGNKTDLPYRAVTTAEGRAVAEKLGVGYAEVSAKSGDKVDDLFVHLLDMLALGKTNGDVEIHNSTVSR
jgi:Ras-related protein Rab-6A